MSLKKLGRYDLIRVLGKGAMGLVYEGRDPNLDRRVAIKTIKVENLSDAAAAEYEVRFRTEARSAARLQHPNIVSVYDSDRDGDIAFLVMEFIQGDDLKHHLDQGELYSLEKTLGIMVDLLSALDYAHRQNIVHRDIKPANLLVEASGRIKLTDFGVARIQDSGEATRTQGSIVGTLKYMSPEQLQGRPIDARADLFAAGVVLYQLLTGQRPFDGDTDFAIIQQIVGHNPDAATSFNPKLPPAMDAVVAQALAKSRDQRFASAQEFSAALQAASREAADPTALPLVSTGGRASSSTWTATLRAGEALVGTQPGTGSTTNTGTSISTGGSTVTQEVELVYWKDIKDSNDLEDLQGFLAKFPAGIYADLARRRLKKLGALPGEDSDTASRSGTVTRLAVASATQFDKTQLLPASGAPARTGTASENTDLAWRALEQTAAQPPLPVQAQPVANPGDDLDATRPGAPLAPTEAVIATPMAEAPVVATGAAVAAPASTPRRMVWAVAGIAALAAAGIGFKMLSGSGSGEPVPAAQAPALAASGAASAPAASAAARPASVASRATAPAAVAAKKGVNDKDKSTKEAATKIAPAAVEHAAPTAAGSPRQACEDRVLIGFQNCMSEQCAKPAFANHPLCVERRVMEQQRREADRLR